MATPHSLSRRILTTTARGKSERQVARIVRMNLVQLRNYKQRHDINIFTSDWVMLSELERELGVGSEVLAEYLPNHLGVRITRYGGHRWRVVHRLDAAKVRRHFEELERRRIHWLPTVEAARRLGLKPSTFAQRLWRRHPSVTQLERVLVPQRKGKWAYRYNPEGFP